MSRIGRAGSWSGCPMPAWRGPDGRPPACVLLAAWDRVDAAAARLDGLAARLAVLLRAHLGGEARRFAREVGKGARSLGLLRMRVAAATASFGTASWTTDPHGMQARLAVIMAGAAHDGADALARCRFAADGLARQLPHIAAAPTRRRASRRVIVIQGLLDRVGAELVPLAEEAEKWTAEAGRR